MDRMPWLVNSFVEVCKLMPDGARYLFLILFFLWFCITLVGVFSATISIIRKVMVFRR